MLSASCFQIHLLHLQEVDAARQRAEELGRRAHEASTQKAIAAAAQAKQREKTLTRRVEAAESRAKVCLMNE